MRIGSLFSGAGMLDVAALELFPGSSVAWHCEVDPAASKVLAHHWPEVPNLGDVTAVDWSAVEPVDVITGGFPCQDVSAAGRQAGLAEGTRSGLWSHMCAAIAAQRPQYVLIENVRGLLSAPAIRNLEPGTDDLGDNSTEPVLRALGAVLGDLADVGFDADWTMLRASDIGASHHRARIFVLAYPSDSDFTGSQGPESAGRHDVSAGGSGEAIALLPTPRATDGTKGGPNQRGSSGDLMLPSAVNRLLPTPEAKLAHSGPDYARAGRAESGGHDLTTAVALGSQWGEYALAIHRQEVLSRPAPAPTEPNSKGNPRLSAAFGEWLMFWPAGWVTDPTIGLSRNEQLKIVGNGVVPRQAVAAFSHLLNLSGVAS